MHHVVVVHPCGGVLLAHLAEGEAACLGLYLRYLRGHYGIVLPVDEEILLGLVLQDAELGGHVVLHLMVVAVHVVGRDVHYHGHVGLEVVHVLQLERAEFDYVHVVVLAGHLQRQALAYVAGQSDVHARLTQNVIGEQGSGGLAVGAGDAHHLGVGVSAGELYLAQYGCPLLGQCPY